MKTEHEFCRSGDDANGKRQAVNIPDSLMIFGFDETIDAASNDVKGRSTADGKRVDEIDKHL